jgi:hypothetical protein
VLGLLVLVLEGGGWFVHTHIAPLIALGFNSRSQPIDDHRSPAPQLMHITHRFSQVTMEGSGVVNYAADKPSYGFSTSTTEFDDALLKRSIITLEQAMLAKGASPEEAARLTRMKNGIPVEEEVPLDRNEPPDEDDDDEGLDDDDDEFLQRYREQRIQELKQTKKRFGEVIQISRPEWNVHVNNDSETCWVVVCLTTSDTERTGCVERAVHQLAQAHADTKFVMIPSTSAIPNWPHENLPSLFLYRHGKMQHQLIQMEHDMNQEQLEMMLDELSIFDEVELDNNVGDDYSGVD